ncbi:Spx/MgsR family RNA polymerase-binding regulatory protein [Agriterribacter sp.]|uniref:Spx/MgsR family RNA polymerase-binding regulatory protein n=1 Tax=Agriterribacter sp. TaxID=2821509 RepID=UPI002BA20F25|nr:Spx/MgsR family RNA polymerase-binding regulatory protein [Agriterribacter sp.]HTN07040.1 Spx/MgsR family RNA polymerase-binding regulatory protein [Agriterribacter sp.]
MIVYGIPNCDSVKKAILWLKKEKIDFTFHNFRESGITAAKLNAWSKQVGWEQVLNKKSTTWRNLTPGQQAAITNQKAAVQVMLTHHSIIKRPVIEYSGKIMVGYNEARYVQELK